jgi:hypothetical protein
VPGQDYRLVRGYELHRRQTPGVTWKMPSRGILLEHLRPSDFKSYEPGRYRALFDSSTRRLIWRLPHLLVMPGAGQSEAPERLKRSTFRGTRDPRWLVTSTRQNDQRQCFECVVFGLQLKQFRMETSLAHAVVRGMGPFQRRAKPGLRRMRPSSVASPPVGRPQRRQLLSSFITEGVNLHHVIAAAPGHPEPLVVGLI